ncbi:MAG: M4 family metallopeptidase [Cyanosarcina radialis HA8281-LM2]|jgi:Zn-dependent metalloprotease|nr:M4 family metallopeptidase [Cyanosarcina radialis HA8281-LM2]
MRQAKSFLKQSSLVLSALLLSFPSAAIANPASISSLQQSGAIVGKNRETGKVTFIGSNSPKGIKSSTTVTSLINSPQNNAQNFLNLYAPSFGINNPAKDLKIIKSFAIDGLPTVKYQQVYNGIPIIGAEINVNLSKDGSLLAMTGEAATNLNLNANPQVSADEAIKTALKVAEKQDKLSLSNVNVTKPELKIYQPGIFDPGSGKARLVWSIEITPKSLLPIERIVLVDAVKPNTIVLTWNNNPDARNRQTHTASNTETIPGTQVCWEWSVGVNCKIPTGTSDAAAAHTFAADTYDFYFNNHGRDSLNGAGGVIRSTVQYGLNYQNAFWNGTQIVYGAGFSQADDVVGHELTHGVTQYTSNLLYYYQSGAINESFSDLWGEFVDLTNGKGNDTAAVRWKIGEDLPGIGAIRDMKNPTLFGEPDKMTSPNYYLGDDDNGGVHTNSGVNNKAVFLMTDGGSFNGRVITGIGITKVAKIYYRAQTTLLSSGSSYYDLHNALNQSCASLVGTAGITTTDCTQVRNAVFAVAMNLEPVTGFQPQAYICPTGKNPVNVFFDDMEASTNWQFSNLVGANPWNFLAMGYAASGQKTLYVADVGSITDSVALQKTGVTIPANAFLHFKHYLEFDPTYDGGVVEYSLNNGATWVDAKNLFNGGQNYNATISTGYNNPLQGRAAFSNFSHGYVSTRYNLAALAGKSVRFRFRQANDSSIGAFGWLVDDVRIYTCQ